MNEADHAEETSPRQEPLADLAEGFSRPIIADNLPRMLEPPPVRLVTVEDAHVLVAAGRERELDEFYVELLELERDPALEPPVYRAANFRVHFDVTEPPIYRPDMRALGVEVLCLREIERRLVEAEIDYEVLKSVVCPGQRSLLLQDPAGNWIELTEAVLIR